MQEYIAEFFNSDYTKFFYLIEIKLREYYNTSIKIDPNDLINEVIINILESKRTFENYNHFKNYLRKSLFNRIISIKDSNWYKIYINSEPEKKVTKKADTDYEFEADENDIPDSIDYNEILDTEIDKEEFIEKLRNILSDIDFEIFILIKEGYIRKQIIAKLGISGKEYNNAYRRIQRKLNK